MTTFTYGVLRMIDKLCVARMEDLYNRFPRVPEPDINNAVYALLKLNMIVEIKHHGPMYMTREVYNGVVNYENNFATCSLDDTIADA